MKDYHFDEQLIAKVSKNKVFFTFIIVKVYKYLFSYTINRVDFWSIVVDSRTTHWQNCWLRFLRKWNGTLFNITSLIILRLYVNRSTNWQFSFAYYFVFLL